DVFPDYPAPIGRKDASGERELAIARWGMPTPPQFIKGDVDYGVTNIRNPRSPHWRRWIGPESRCVVPATSFSEYGPQPDPVTKKKPLYWFALNEEKPLFWFAGIWTPWYANAIPTTITITARTVSVEYSMRNYHTMTFESRSRTAAGAARKVQGNAGAR
ncbi:SOS response-associated peptidase family protein, partial [Phyllobacterium endophyticum]|uniref:SOS response-associated peptidase family protein n=1 Tax=Phyllobacterium endophyticum TaxID=1149773 RepID=UPI0011DB47D2